MNGDPKSRQSLNFFVTIIECYTLKSIDKDHIHRYDDHSNKPVYGLLEEKTPKHCKGA